MGMLGKAGQNMMKHFRGPKGTGLIIVMAAMGVLLLALIVNRYFLGGG